MKRKENAGDVVDVLAEREEAFRRGFTDCAHGVDREKCPYPSHADLRRAWRDGWNKSSKGLVMDLPK